MTFVILSADGGFRAEASAEPLPREDYTERETFLSVRMHVSGGTDVTLLFHDPEHLERLRHVLTDGYGAWKELRDRAPGRQPAEVAVGEPAA